MKYLLPCLCCALLVALGCSNGDDATSSGSPSSAGMTPAELCTERCQLQVDAKCASTPPNYLSSCTSICLAKYTKYPSCDAVLRALDACAIDRVSYACTQGIALPMPAGACATEAGPCAGCTNDPLGCL